MAAYDDEDDDGVTGAFVYGNGPNDEDDDGAPQSGTGSSNAGKAVAASAPAAAPAPTSNEDDDLKPPTYNPTPLAAPPQSHLQEYQQLEQQLAAKPPSMNDPNLRPSIGRRIAGALAGAMVAAGSRNPTAGLDLGESVVNAPYNRALNQYQGKQQAAQQQLSALRGQNEMEEQNWENSLQAHNSGVQDYNTQERAYQGQVYAQDRRSQAARNNQNTALQRAAPDDKNNPLGPWSYTDSNGKQQQLAGPPDWWLKTPAGKSAVSQQQSQQDEAQREANIKKWGLTGEQAMQYRVNGHIPPAQRPERASAEEIMQNREINAFRKEYGREPNFEDLQRMRGNPRAANPQAPDQVGAIVADATQRKQQFADRYTRNKDGSNYSDSQGNTLSPKEFEDKIDGFRTEANRRLAKFGAQIDGQGNVVRNQSGQQNPPQSAPQQPQSPGNLPRGNGKPLDRTTAQQFLQAAGGDKAQARAIAAKNGWKF